MTGRGPMLCRDADRGLGEHQIRQHGPADASGDLNRKVGQRRRPRDATEEGVDEGHHGVEVGSRDRPEHHDGGVEARTGGGGVLQELQPCVAGREVLRRDTGADDDGGQEGTADQFGQQPAGEGSTGHGAGRRRAAISSTGPPGSRPGPRPHPRRRRANSRSRHRRHPIRRGRRPGPCTPPRPHRRGR